MNYYEILNIDRSATDADIKKAYRRLAAKHHPDRGGDTKKFQEIQAAYDVLSDPAKRAEYDNPQPGPQHFNFQGGAGLDEIFRQFGFSFGQGPDPFAGFRQQQQQRRNKDTRIDIGIPLSETLYEQTKTLNIKNQNGSVEQVSITIPRGITHHTVVKYSNLGDNMFNNLPRGDLLVRINIIPNSDFIVQGLDLVKSISIDCFDAILGCKQNVYELDGKLFALQVPAGCQPFTKLKIPGEGLYAFQQDVKGNLYIQVEITMPKLTAEQIELVRQIKNKE